MTGDRFKRIAGDLPFKFDKSVSSDIMKIISEKDQK